MLETDRETAVGHEKTKFLRRDTEKEEVRASGGGGGKRKRSILNGEIPTHNPLFERCPSGQNWWGGKINIEQGEGREGESNLVSFPPPLSTSLPTRSVGRGGNQRREKLWSQRARQGKEQ